MLLAEDIKTTIEVAVEPNEVGGGVTWEGMRMVDKAARAAVVGTRARVAEAGLHQEEGDRGREEEGKGRGRGVVESLHKLGLLGRQAPTTPERAYL